MRRRFLTLAILTVALAISLPAWATNGDNLIGVGPISRAMGGVGVAAPQDAISAIFANPAAMCFGPSCPGSEATFAGTFFSPTVNGTVVNNGALVPLGVPVGTYTAKSRLNPFVVPAIGITSPINDRLRFGLGAYGISGMGVDYKGESPAFFNTYTKLEIMKFAPNLAYLITPNFSIGANVSVSYQNLDLGAGGAHDYALGAQIGLLYHVGMFNIGASYTTPQGVTHTRVANFDASVGSTTFDDLKLQQPPVYALGVSMDLTSDLLLELNAKYLPWAEQEGYKDFDWENQWSYALGAQYKLNDTWTLRAGWNYAKNPVKEHQGFNPAGATNVQGVAVPNVGYEYLRIIGFPGIVENHVTLGLGWNLTESLIMNLSYMHAFENTITETSAGNAISLESTLKEDSLSMGFTWRF